MKKVSFFFSTCLLVLAVLEMSGCQGEQATRYPTHWAAPQTAQHLKNFYKVSDRLYRCQQPSQEGYQELEALGITTVINLRQHHDDSSESLGTSIRVVEMPTPTSSLSIEHIEKFLRTLLHPDSGVVCVHCMHGSDRTGTMCAAYRMVVEGWTVDEAISEFVDGPFGHHDLLFKNLPRLLKELDVNDMRARLSLQ